MKNPNIPLNSNELSELNCFLEKAELSLSYLHGLFCVIISSSSSSIITSSQWQEIIFDDLEFDSEQELERTLALIFRFYNSVNKNLRDDNFKPLLYQELNSNLDDLELAQDWSVGYLTGTQLDDFLDNFVQDNEDLQTLLFPAIFLAYLDTFENAAQEHSIPRQKILEAIDFLEKMNQALYISMQKISKEFVKLDLDRTHNQMHEPKRQGRKELCACGSGKKYKKCCLELDQNNSVSSLISEK